MGRNRDLLSNCHPLSMVILSVAKDLLSAHGDNST